MPSSSRGYNGGVTLSDICEVCVRWWRPEQYGYRGPLQRDGYQGTSEEDPSE